MVIRYVSLIVAYFGFCNNLATCPLLGSKKGHGVTMVALESEFLDVSFFEHIIQVKLKTSQEIAFVDYDNMMGCLGFGRRMDNIDQWLMPTFHAKIHFDHDILHTTCHFARGQRIYYSKINFDFIQTVNHCSRQLIRVSISFSNLSTFLM